MLSSSTIGAIILAAGSSSRMGTSKQLLEVDGKSMLTRTVDAVLNAGLHDVVVVLGANEAAHRAALGNSKVHITANQRWAAGMGSSIKAGVNYLLKTVDGLQAAIILVCDQPMLTKDTIESIILRFRNTNKPIIGCGYDGVAGVPALFARPYLEKLLQLSDDQGARRIMVQNPGDVAIVPFIGGEIDLDTREDYERFLASSQS